MLAPLPTIHIRVPRPAIKVPAHCTQCSKVLRPLRRIPFTRTRITATRGNCQHPINNLVHLVTSIAAQGEVPQNHSALRWVDPQPVAHTDPAHAAGLVP